MRVLLDTCAFVWLCCEPTHFPAAVRDILADRATRLFLSDASVIEIALKAASGKLRLPQPARTWVGEQTRIWRASSLTLDHETIFLSAELPAIHRDPFDRLIVAAALINKIPVLTPDTWIQQYPAEVIWS